MPPIHLSDSELDAVMAAARPLPVERRDAFLQSVANSLQRCGEIGPGVVHRICAEVQRARTSIHPISHARLARLGGSAERRALIDHCRPRQHHLFGDPTRRLASRGACTRPPGPHSFSGSSGLSRSSSRYFAVLRWWQLRQVRNKGTFPLSHCQRVLSPLPQGQA
jgi:hypothetical protein